MTFRGDEIRKRTSITIEVNITSPDSHLAGTRERISKEKSGKNRLLQGDVREIERGTDRYDIVLAAAVLHHLRDEADWKFVFKKIYNAIRLNGSFWISDMVFHDLTAIQELMKKIGFKKIEVLHKSSCFAAFGGVKTRSFYTKKRR